MQHSSTKRGNGCADLTAGPYLPCKVPVVEALPVVPQQQASHHRQAQPKQQQPNLQRTASVRVIANRVSAAMYWVMYPACYSQNSSRPTCREAPKTTAHHNTRKHMPRYR
jgi:hypothetical protein